MSKLQAEQQVPSMQTVLGQKCQKHSLSTTLSQKLNAQMKVRGMTYYQLSRATDIPVTSIQNYLAGRSFPNGARLDQLSRALKTTTGKLVR